MGCRPTRGILERSESHSRRDIQSGHSRRRQPRDFRWIRPVLAGQRSFFRHHSVWRLGEGLAAERHQAILYEIRTITENIDPTVNGTYRTTLHVVSINLRMNYWLAVRSTTVSQIFGVLSAMNWAAHPTRRPSPPSESCAQESCANDWIV